MKARGGTFKGALSNEEEKEKKAYQKRKVSQKQIF